MSRSSLGQHLASVVILVVSISAALFLILNRQWVLDQVALWQYEPPAEIVALADRTAMTDDGRQAFYASRPVLQATTDFRGTCGNNEEGTAVLGCYTNRLIYIFNVTDIQLDGIKDVTAAHEMLHAVYERLSESERARVDGLLESEYQKLAADDAFTDRMAYYAKVEPGERNNELHSIIATEVATIDPQLETYYKKYFADRAAVVRLHATYSSVFERLKTQGDELSRRLDVLATSIEQASEAYNVASQQLNRDINTFNRRATQGEFETQAEFNAERSGLAARSEDLAADRQSINNMISEYNQLRDQLATIATQTQALNRSIDSSLAPAPTL